MSNQTLATPKFLRIGEIAERAGVSAKALRLYQKRKLLQPCTHSPAGYRLYGPQALLRLMQIVLLRRSGFSLAQIGGLLARDPQSGARLLVERIAVLEREVAEKSQALVALRLAASQVGSTAQLNVDQLLESIAMTQQLEVNLTPAERAAFNARAEKIGSAGLEQAQNAWPALIAEVRAAMTAGTPADDAAVIEMGRRWHALVTSATGGDPAVSRKLSEAYVAQPGAMAAQGMDMDMFRYIGQAMAQSGLKLFP